jgi:hypothetical protein
MEGISSTETNFVFTLLSSVNHCLKLFASFTMGTTPLKMGPPGCALGVAFQGASYAAGWIGEGDGGAGGAAAVAAAPSEIGLSLPAWV